MGFTLLELLVVVAILLILGALILASVHNATGKASMAFCLNNMKQLQVSWQLYTDDFQERVPVNRSYQENGIWRSTPDSWIGNSSALYDRDTSAIENGLMFKYDYDRKVESYRCPADESFVVKTEIPRTRSYSMNATLGGNYDPNKPDEVRRNVSRTVQIRTPSRLFVFIDEHEDSIDDAHFLVWASPDRRWVNMPADRHQKGATVSFADGHAERLAWRWPKNFKDKKDYFKPAANEADLADLRELQSIADP